MSAGDMGVTRPEGRAEYAYGYCGMPCALCTRYRTQGTSRCPGCSHDGYYTEACKAHRCCRERELAHCGECGEYPCARLGKMGDFRDLNTDHAKQRGCAVVAERGFAAWYAEYAQRAEMLTEALARYNDGRMKRYLCEMFIRRDMGRAPRAFVPGGGHNRRPQGGRPGLSGAGAGDARRIIDAPKAAKKLAGRFAAS